MDIENIQGHPRSFIASYAKDIVYANTKAGFYDNKEDKGNPIVDYDFWADHIYEWVMQDVLGPMTDVQYQFIEDLMVQKKYIDEKVQAVKNNIRNFNVKQASEFIEMLLNDEELPPEYQEKWRQMDIRKAVSSRTARDGS